MTATQQEFVAGLYAERTEAYLQSRDHSAGDDLDQLETLLTGASEARVLDLGCGGGHVSYRAAPRVAEVVACDVTESMLHTVARTASERGLTNIRVQQAAAENLPFADGSFDFVLCRFTAHHWQNFEAGLREARRVLRTDGRAVFIDTVAPADPLLDSHLQTFELLRDPSHVRNYDAAEWVASLARSGFLMESATPRRLRMDFAAWIARTGASAQAAEAVRQVQLSAPRSVVEHLAVEPDGSFHLDTLTLVARPEQRSG